MSFLGRLPVFDYKTSEWAIFKSRLSQFLIVNSIKENESAILITHLSDESYRLLRNLAYPEDIDGLTYKALITLLDAHFKPKECTFADKAKFYGAMRSPDESLGEWVARLRGLASYCDFGAALETNLRDRFVLGIGSGPERDRLFEQKPSTLTLASALELAEQAACAREAKAVGVKEEPIFRAQFIGAASERGGGSAGAVRGRAGAPRGHQASRSTVCSVCGLKNHNESQCRYKTYKCKKCGKQGHLKKVCGERSRFNNVNNIDEIVECVSSADDTECEECRLFNLRYVTIKPIELEVLIGKQPINMELDTGSGTSVISEKLYKNVFSTYNLSECRIKMCLYNGHKISPLGFFVCDTTYNNETKKIKFFVIRNGGPPLLGRDFMSAFRLTLATKLNNMVSDGEVSRLLEQFSELWRDELGTFNKFTVTLQLKQNSTPKFFKPRPVPFALKVTVEKELNRLVSLGILVPVDYSQYATPIVPVLKENGKVRIAGDFSVTLNQDLIIDKYPLPRIEEVFAKIGGGEKYSKIDLKNAYNQFVLSDESQELTTINTQRGLYKYTRLVYGLANAPAIFQKSMETLLSGIDGVSCWLDDICVTGPNKQVHLERLREVLQRLKDAGLRLQKEKCEFFKSSVTYLGYVINKNGLQSCPGKVQAILNSPDPTDITGVKRFLGMVNYYRNFIPNASAIMNPLHDLLRADTKWVWGPRQREAVQLVKRELASERVLAHFEPSAQLVLTVDAGPAGLGAVLAQRDATAGTERPLAYASRSLSVSEKNYSQIQKEATAIIFGIKRFHQYLYGRNDPFILKTDHRPLVSIFNCKTGISMTSALRLQRYAIILSAYNYVVQYTSGENNVAADYFSRAPLNDVMSNTDGVYDKYCSLNFLNASSPAVSLSSVQQATENDKVLQTVFKYMLRGWPRKIKCSSVLPYFRCKSDLQVENGCLLRGPKVVIPHSLTHRMLDELHNSHLGIVKMKLNARSRMWWPGIDADIERHVGGCETCASVRAAPPRATPAPWPRSLGPWQRIHIDYMSIGQRVYLVIIDAYSKWIECLLMSNGTCTKALISKLKQIFSIFGIPNLLVSDNDVKINSLEFNDFCSNNGIKYMTSPIYHPCSNGQAENTVRICKKILKCILKDNLSHQLIHEKLIGYLFDYRNSVHCSTGETPAKLMFGRNLRTRLDLILPKNTDITISSENIKLNVANCRNFKNGDLVWVRWYNARKESWIQGRVINKIGNRMYKIFIKDHNVQCIRHIDQIMKYVVNKDYGGSCLADKTLPEPHVTRRSGPSSPRSMSNGVAASTSREEPMVERCEEVEERDAGMDCEGIDSESTCDKSAEESEIAQSLIPRADTGTSESIANANQPWSQRLRPRNR